MGGDGGSRARIRPLAPGGLLTGVLAIALSLTPSLVPRPALLQGVLSGVSFAFGYAIGVGIGALVVALAARLDRDARLPPRLRSRPVRWTIAAVALLGLVVVAILAVGWQNEVRALVELAPIDGVDTLAFLGGLLGSALLLLAAARGIRALNGALRRRLRRRPGVAPIPAASIAIAATAGIVIASLAILVGGGMVAVDRIWWGSNGAPDPAAVRPDAPERSGSPDSLVRWEDLGRHGAAFVSTGPSAADIEAATGLPALEPVRVYVGLASAPTLRERAELAVAELERAGGLERSVLVVVLPTGSGWIEAQTVDSLEYVAGGDTAIVGLQYAYTPSWATSIFDEGLPDATAAALFDAVEARWSQLPADDRPRLIVHGLSLGAQGTQNAFGSLEAILQRTDGALFVGLPGTVALWRELQASRDAGSPAWQPVLDDGRTVRWGSLPGDLDRPPGPWSAPRVVYLQHATDPVTWLAPELFWSAPEWLRADQRGADVSPRMVWIPVVTGLQVTVDMLMGTAVPARHGHNYGDVMVDAWMGVLGDVELSPAAIAAVSERIAELAPILPFEE